MSISLKIPTARVFKPLLQPSRYKGAHGGRGSGKSHFFADMVVDYCVQRPGMKVLCIRELQKSLAQSSKSLVEGKISSLNVGDRFRILHDRIITPGDGVIVFQGMQDQNNESVKSLEGFRVAWVDEAQTLSDRSFELLRPTIREQGSEIWASWNPTRKSDAMDKFLRIDPPANAIVVQANWRDNPWWNETLEAERQLFLAREPDRYDHVWEGDYAKAFKGAYFASVLTAARQEGRIGFVPRDPLLPVVAYFDIGGAGHKADATAIWFVQFVAQEIRVLDYLEAQSQVMAYYVAEIRRRGHDHIHCVLPHDGINVNNQTGNSYEGHLRDAGFSTEVVPNQGAGAAMARVDAVRRIFPACRFNEATCAPGLDALGYYHEKYDDKRNVGMGPAHNWASHGADAFGLMAIKYEDPTRWANRPIQIGAIDDLNPRGVFMRGGFDMRNFPDAIEE